jgi:hypothetical protein
MRIECGCIKTRTRRRVLLGKQLRQLRDIDRNPPPLRPPQQPELPPMPVDAAN